MYTVSDKLKQYIKSTGRHFTLKLKVGQNEYSDEIAEATVHYPFSDDKMTIGKIYSAYADITMYSRPENISGCEVELSLCTDAVENEEIKLGIFTAENVKTTDGLTTFSAYDRAKTKTAGEYQSAYTSKTSVANVYSEVCAGCGVGLVPLATADGEREIDPTMLGGKDRTYVLSQIAGFLGGNLIANRDGKFEVRKYSDCTENYDEDTFKDPEIGENVFVLHSLTCTNSKETFSVGTGDGISLENELMTSERLGELLKELDGFSYRPVKCEILVGDPKIEVGDVVSLSLGEKTYSVPVMKLELEYDGGVSTTIKSYAQSESEKVTSGESISEKLHQSKAYTDEVKNAYSGFRETLKTGLEKGLYQTVITCADGSSVNYYHDKPTLEEATYIQVFTSSGRAWVQGSNCWNNGNPQWQYGETKDGDAILRDLLVRTLTADLIRAGKLSSFDGTTLFDLDKGEITTAKTTAENDVETKISALLSTGILSFSKEIGVETVSSTILGNAGMRMETVEPDEYEYTFTQPENWENMSDLEKWAYEIMDKLKAVTKYVSGSYYGINIKTTDKAGEEHNLHLDGMKQVFSDKDLNTQSEYRSDGAKIRGELIVNGGDVKVNVPCVAKSKKYDICYPLAFATMPVDFKNEVTFESGEEPAHSHFVQTGYRTDVFYQGAKKTHNSGDLLFTMPNGLRPATQTLVPFTKNGNAFGNIIFDIDGQVKVGYISDTGASGRICFQCTYFTGDLPTGIYPEDE